MNLRHHLHLLMFYRGLAVGMALLLCLPPTDVLAASASRSIFATKKASYDAVQQRNLRELDAKQGMLGKEKPSTDHRLQSTATAQPLSLAGLEDLSAINIPPEDGQVLEVWSPPDRGGQTASPTVVLLQDLHTQPDAQLAEGRILQHLHKTYNLQLVASEGATGPFQLDFFQQFPKDKALRTLIAKTFLTAGEMTGHEYQAITEQLPIHIYGVEEPQLYADHGEVFKQILDIAPAAQHAITQWQQALDALKPQLYPKPLQAFLQQTEAFQRGDLALPDYVRQLASLAEQQGVVLEVLVPNLGRLQQVQQLEESINRQQVEAELQRLLPALAAQLQQDASVQLRAEVDTLTSQFQQQAIAPTYFYPKLVEVARHATLDLSVYPALTAFTDYLQLTQAVQSHRIVPELEQLEWVLTERLAGTEEAKTLATLSRHAHLLQELFSLKFTPDQVAYYQAHRQEFMPQAFQVFLERYHVSLATDTTPSVGAHLPLVERFYALAHARDSALVEHTLQWLQERPTARARSEKPDAVLLIAGGFHTPGVTALLREREIPYVVVSLTAAGELDEELYHRLVRGETMPLEEKVHLAHHLHNSETFLPAIALGTAPANYAQKQKEAQAIAIEEGFSEPQEAVIETAVEHAAAEYAKTGEATSPATVAQDQKFQAMRQATQDADPTVIAAKAAEVAKAHGSAFAQWLQQHWKVLAIAVPALVLTVLFAPELVELASKKAEVAGLGVSGAMTFGVGVGQQSKDTTTGSRSDVTAAQQALADFVGWLEPKGDKRLLQESMQPSGLLEALRILQGAKDRSYLDRLIDRLETECHYYVDTPIRDSNGRRLVPSNLRRLVYALAVALDYSRDLPMYIHEGGSVFIGHNAALGRGEQPALGSGETERLRELLRNFHDGADPETVRVQLEQSLQVMSHDDASTAMQALCDWSWEVLQLTPDCPVPAADNQLAGGVLDWMQAMYKRGGMFLVDRGNNVLEVTSKDPLAEDDKAFRAYNGPFVRMDWYAAQGVHNAGAPVFFHTLGREKGYPHGALSVLWVVQCVPSNRMLVLVGGHRLSRGDKSELGPSGGFDYGAASPAEALDREWGGELGDVFDEMPKINRAVVLKTQPGGSTNVGYTYCAFSTLSDEAVTRTIQRAGTAAQSVEGGIYIPVGSGEVAGVRVLDTDSVVQSVNNMPEFWARTDLVRAVLQLVPDTGSRKPFIGESVFDAEVGVLVVDAGRLRIITPRTPDISREDLLARADRPIIASEAEATAVSGAASEPTRTDSITDQLQTTTTSFVAQRSDRRLEPVRPEDDADLVILATSRIDTVKDYIGFVEAVALVRAELDRQGQTVTVEIHGASAEGPSQQAYAERVRARVKELGLEGVVTFYGRYERNELGQIFNKHDRNHVAVVYMLSSFSEGFGWAVLEAMRYGVPVVMPNLDVAKELMGGSEAGIVVEAGGQDPAKAEQLAQAILKLFGDPALRKRYGEQGIKIAEQYSWRKMVEEYLAAFNRFVRNQRLGGFRLVVVGTGACPYRIGGIGSFEAGLFKGIRTLSQSGDIDPVDIRVVATTYDPQQPLARFKDVLSSVEFVPLVTRAPSNDSDASPPVPEAAYQEFRRAFTGFVGAMRRIDPNRRVQLQGLDREGTEELYAMWELFRKYGYEPLVESPKTDILLQELFPELDAKGLDMVRHFLFYYPNLRCLNASMLAESGDVLYADEFLSSAFVGVTSKLEAENRGVQVPFIVGQHGFQIEELFRRMASPGSGYFDTAPEAIQTIVRQYLLLTVKIVLFHADEVIVISEALRQWSIDRLGVPPDRIRVIRYGLNDEDLSTVASSTVATSSAGQSTKTLQVLPVDRRQEQYEPAALEKAIELNTSDQPIPARFLSSDSILFVLAGGQGVRLGATEERPKPVWAVAGKPMICRITDAAEAAALPTVVTGGFGVQAVQEVLGGRDVHILTMYADPSAQMVEAMRLLKGYKGNIIIVAGDMPAITPGLLRKLRAQSGAAAIATFVVDDPSGYSRILRDREGRLARILVPGQVELLQRTAGSITLRDGTVCTAENIVKIHEVFNICHVFNAEVVLPLLENEQLLWDPEIQTISVAHLVNQMVERGLRVEVVPETVPGELKGVNTPEQLEQMDRYLKDRSQISTDDKATLQPESLLRGQQEDLGSLPVSEWGADAIVEEDAELQEAVDSLAEWQQEEVGDQTVIVGNDSQTSITGDVQGLRIWMDRRDGTIYITRAFYNTPRGKDALQHDKEERRRWRASGAPREETEEATLQRHAAIVVDQLAEIGIQDATGVKQAAYDDAAARQLLIGGLAERDDARHSQPERLRVSVPEDLDAIDIPRATTSEREADVADQVNPPSKLSQGGSPTQPVTMISVGVPLGVSAAATGGQAYQPATFIGMNVDALATQLSQLTDTVYIVEASRAQQEQQLVEFLHGVTSNPENVRILSADKINTEYVQDLLKSRGVFIIANREDVESRVQSELLNLLLLDLTGLSGIFSGGELMKILLLKSNLNSLKDIEATQRAARMV